MTGEVPAELQLLGLGCLLVVVQIVLVAQLSNLQYGLKWAAGVRDEAPPPPGILLGRARRALANLLETFPIFAAAVLAVASARRFDGLTLVGAHLYLWARVAYLGLYLAGAPLVRSLAWNIALLGIFLILLRLA
ncbi:MAG: MAPEG family protein [Sphingomonadales bacterium]|nr:MAPEG family protein [Sphingomonadales bacterium]